MPTSTEVISAIENGEPGAPNLDHATTDHDMLMSWWFEVSHHPVRAARRMFPDTQRCSGCQRGAVLAARNLAHYAANKATAMACRERGDITAARVYETICELIYDRLPSFARW